MNGLDADADMNANENYGRIPLSWPSSSGRDAVVQRLLDVHAIYGDESNAIYDNFFSGIFAEGFLAMLLIC